MRPGTTWGARVRRTARGTTRASVVLGVLAGLLALSAPGASAAERAGQGCAATSAPALVDTGHGVQPVVALVCPAAVRVRVRVVSGTASAIAAEQVVRAGRPAVLRGTAFDARPGSSYRVVVDLTTVRGRALPALSGASTVPVPAVTQVPLGVRAAAVALAEVGRRDRTRYGAPAGAPWCAFFATWVTRHVDPSAPLLTSVAAWRDWGRAHHRWSSEPQVGDVVVYGSSHVGVVVRVRGDGTIDTVEGNFSHRVSHNRVRLDRATASHEPAPISGFVRPY